MKLQYVIRFMRLWAFAGLFFSSQVWAAKLSSYCYMKADDPHQKIEGQRIDDRLPIASVSKLITTYWALSVMSPDDRYSTRIFIDEVATDAKGKKIVDLHFAGSRDPYFGKETLHYLASELNKMGITRIRNLTFDEKFKFFWNVGGGKVLNNPNGQKVETGYYYEDSPNPNQIINELRRVRGNLTTGYATTRNQLKQFNIQLIPNATLSAQNIKFVSALDFVPDQKMIVRTVSSSPLIMLLREMNRNSNNHAANQIFESLGGVQTFAEFMRQQGFYESDVLFVNGHGNRKDLSDGKSVYNEGSCSMILNVMARLRKRLQQFDKDMDDVLPVPAAPEKSTLDSYVNTSFSNSLAAKTGTVNPAVTLAGMLQTKEGPIFFMYNMSTRGTTSDWARARNAIAQHLRNLLKKFNGGIPFELHQVKFVAFDPEMFFQKDDWKESPQENVSNMSPVNQVAATELPKTP